MSLVSNPQPFGAETKTAKRIGCSLRDKRRAREDRGRGDGMETPAHLFQQDRAS